MSRFQEILIFFKATNSDISYLIKNKLLKPINKGGMILFRLGDIMDATFHLTKQAKGNAKISLLRKQ